MALPRFTCAGNLGAAPEMFRSDSGGGLRAVFSICFHTRYQAGGKQVNETCWFDAIAWGRAASQIEILARDGKMVKGSWVLVEAEVQENRWTENDPDGNPVDRRRHRLKIWNVWLPPPRVG